VLTRRKFLETVGVLAGVAACRGGGASSASTSGAALSTGARRLQKVGIQLYTVRREMQRDMPDTLARLGEIGYREVEFAGYFNRSAPEVRRLLEANNLAAPSTHIGYDRIAKDWDRALDEAAAMGHSFVTVPWLPDSVRTSADSWRRVADDFTRAGARAKARGLRFAYHNHDFEWVRVDGAVPYDLLLDNTDPAVVDFQMDIYWTVKAGGDPLAYLKKYPSRFAMVHVKDSGGPPNHQQVDVGSGTIAFPAIFRLDAEQRHAIQHAFVEHDEPADPLDFARKSYAYLSTMEF
jgi:sugar phosphate isomerase/epimerase